MPKRLSMAAVLLMATTAVAQTTDPETSVFDELSSGNQKIAQSMFDAQDGDSNWTLEEISMAKQDGEGWGQVFQRMKEEGLFAEKNLGQVVSGQGKTDSDIGGVTSGAGAAGSTGSASAKGPKRIVITTGAGGQVGAGLKGHGRDNAKGAKDKGVKVTTGAGAVGNAKAVHVTTGAGPGGAAVAGGIKATHFKIGGGAGGASLSGGGPAKRR